LCVDSQLPWLFLLSADAILLWETTNQTKARDEEDFGLRGGSAPEFGLRPASITTQYTENNLLASHHRSFGGTEPIHIPINIFIN